MAKSDSKHMGSRPAASSKHAKHVCALCNKNEKKLVAEGLCDNCYVQKHPLLLHFKEIEVKACPSCSKYFTAGKWKAYENIWDVINLQIIDSLHYDSSVVTDVVIEALAPNMNARAESTIKGEAVTKIKGKILGCKLEDTYLIPFRVLMQQCNNCSKKNTQYFEGVFQLRAESHSLNKGSYKSSLLLARAADYIRNLVRKNSRKGVYITKEKTFRSGNDISGIDFYITKQKFVQWLGRKLQEQFGGDLIVSSTLFTRNFQTSRDVYRVNTLLRLPAFCKGDIVLVDDHLVRVNNFGKKLTGIDLSRGKSVSYDVSRLKSRPVLIEIEKAVVSTLKPKIEVLHPHTYDSVLVENQAVAASRGLSSGHEICVVVHKSRVWVV